MAPYTTSIPVRGPRQKIDFSAETDAICDSPVYDESVSMAPFA